jgi:ATP-dependent RNA helicase RhlE
LSQRFDSLILDQRLLDSIADMRYQEMTPVQEQAIPVALTGRDVIVVAQTGTGKTAAFLIPLISRFLASPAPGIRGLILTPTRELAIQIDEHFSGLAYHAGLGSGCVVGGVPFGPQEEAIRSGVDVLVATPGRLLDHMRFDYVDFSRISYVVLDEADRMFDMGFLPDLMRILARLPKARQTLLFSATIDAEVKRLALEHLRDPQEIRIGLQVPVDAVAQHFIAVSPSDKRAVLINLLRNRDIESALIFVATKRGAQQLDKALWDAGFESDAIHGDREQAARNLALERFRRGDVEFLVATDVASRGLDIPDISHVINFDFPRDPDDYLHRIGRTARAKKKGSSITFVGPEDGVSMSKLERSLGKRIDPVASRWRKPQRRGH